jgi:hypothetical protein
MISILILIIIFGCFFLYNTSKKAILQKHSFIDKWLQENNTKTKYLGIFILFITLILSVVSFGFTSGILFWIFTVTLSLSLILVLYPLKIFSIKKITILFAISLLIELTLNH